MELSSAVQFRRITDEGTQEYTFAELTTELSTAGVDEVSIILKFEVTNVFGNSAEKTMYRITVPIHLNMTFKEAVQNSAQYSLARMRGRIT